MTYVHDNRYAPGSSGAFLDDESTPAAYSGRWIDRNYYAEIVPDRQGFAYDLADYRDQLMGLLNAERAHENTGGMQERDQTVQRMCADPELTMYLRRAGGYVYVDAWLTTEGS